MCRPRQYNKNTARWCCVADPDPGSGAPLTTWIRDPDREWTSQIIFVKAWKQFFRLKYRYLNSLMRIRIRIRDPGNFLTLDPQQWYLDADISCAGRVTCWPRTWAGARGWGWTPAPPTPPAPPGGFLFASHPSLTLHLGKWALAELDISPDKSCVG